MREMPDLYTSGKSTLITTQFRGYNHNEIIRDGEMYEMENLSGDRYPLLTLREKRGITQVGQQTLTGIHGRDQLVYCLGTRVYYNMQEVQGISVSAAPEMCPKQIVSMGAYVCIWPDKVYFNTADATDRGSMNQHAEAQGADVNLCMCRGDGTNYDTATIITGPVAPDSPANGQLWIDTSGSNDVLRQWSSATEEWVEVATTYVKIGKTGIGAGLREYDVVEIAGLAADTDQLDPSAGAKTIAQVAALNGSHIIYGAGQNYIIVAGLLNVSMETGSLADNTVTIDRNVPDLDFIVESNNRLWGCRYGLLNGQTVNEIKACKLGDFRCWDTYMNISTDSYTASVGTDGPFTGAATQRGYPVFFKEECIHRVSGNQPSNFGITTTMCRGVQRGSGRSVAVVNEAIYYKSRDGVMVYDGNMPMSVSEPLGQVLYSDARAGALGGKYYISMMDPDGGWHMFKYDTEKDLWFHEDAVQAMGFGRSEDELWYIDEEHNTLVTVRGTSGEREGSLPWRATFGLFGTDYTNRKYLSRFNIRIWLEPTAKARLEIEYDGDGKWHDFGEMRGRSLKTIMIPVIPRRCDHLRFRISGKGDAKIYAISRELEVGGDG